MMIIMKNKINKLVLLLIFLNKKEIIYYINILINSILQKGKKNIFSYLFKKIEILIYNS